MSAGFYIGGYVAVVVALLILLFWLDDGHDEFGTRIGVVGCFMWPLVAPCAAVFFLIWGFNIGVKSIRSTTTGDHQ